MRALKSSPIDADFLSLLSSLLFCSLLFCSLLFSVIFSSSLTNALEHGLARDVAPDDGEDVARVELGHGWKKERKGRSFFFFSKRKKKKSKSVSFRLRRRGRKKQKGRGKDREKERKERSLSLPSLFSCSHASPRGQARQHDRAERIAGCCGESSSSSRNSSSRSSCSSRRRPFDCFC